VRPHASGRAEAAIDPSETVLDGEIDSHSRSRASGGLVGRVPPVGPMDVITLLITIPGRKAADCYRQLPIATD
jgi:hypothetical protein